MIARLLPGVLLRTAMAQIDSTLNELRNRQGAAQTPLNSFNAYQRWANEQARVLSHTVTSESLDHLITSPRYELLQRIDPGVHGSSRHCSTSKSKRAGVLVVLQSRQHLHIGMLEGAQFVHGNPFVRAVVHSGLLRR